MLIDYCINIITTCSKLRGKIPVREKAGFNALANPETSRAVSAHMLVQQSFTFNRRENSFLKEQFISQCEIRFFPLISITSACEVTIWQNHIIHLKSVKKNWQESSNRSRNGNVDWIKTKSTLKKIPQKILKKIQRKIPINLRTKSTIYRPRAKKILSPCSIKEKNNVACFT